jgi:hypothetical protein
MRAPPAALHHVAEFLNLVGKTAEFVLHLFQRATRTRRFATCHGGRKAAADLGLGRSAVRPLLLAMELLAHLAHHFLQVLGGLIQACGAEVLDGLGDMIDFGLRVAKAVRSAIAAGARAVLRTRRLRLVGAPVRARTGLFGESRGREGEGGGP